MRFHTRDHYNQSIKDLLSLLCTYNCSKYIPDVLSTNLAVFTDLEELLLTVSSSSLWCEAHSGSDLCATLTILCRALLLDVLQLECCVELQRVSKMEWGSVTARVNTKWIQSTLKQSKVFSSCAGWGWLQPVQRQRSALSLHFWGGFTLTREPSPHWWC